MKKRILSLLTTLVMVVGFVGVMPSVSAGALTSGDFEYDVLEDGTVEITNYTGNATELNIPSEIAGKKVTSIGFGAFKGCETLKAIIIPENIVSIGNYAFADCFNLTKIEYNAIDASSGINDNIESHSLFADAGKNSSGISVVIGNKVKAIPESLFWSNNRKSDNPPNIKNVTIGTNVEIIGDGAFARCENIESIIFKGNNVNKIDNRAFTGCSSIKSITIPNGVESIGYNAFAFCQDLTSVTIPDSVTSIGEGAFVDCSSLTRITIPDGVTCIESDVFSGCSSLISVMIPDSVTSIGDSAFACCSSLTRITIPDGVISIGERSFYACYNISSITMGDSITSIGFYAFSGTFFIDNQTTDIKYVGKWAVDCDFEVRTATIKEGTVGIADYAFSNEDLESVSIPDTVKIIGEGAFYHCDSLESIIIPDSITIIGSYAFGYIYDYETDEEVRLDDFKIYCYSGTEGEQYAIDNGFDYEIISKGPIDSPEPGEPTNPADPTSPVDPHLGDLSCDGQITTADVGIINSFARGVTNPTPEQLALADANGDGEITTVDVGLINKIAKGV